MRVMHDYLLVKEVIQNNTLEGTTLKTKYDDTERFMFVEVIEASDNLCLEYAKYYPNIGSQEARLLVKQCYAPGTQLIINRVAKTPYKDGLYFISFKDVIAIEKEVIPKVSEVMNKQLSVFDFTSSETV